MLIYWMPYLTLSYPHRGPKEIRVGKAVFFEDTPANWSQLVGRERPKHLEIHRNFPSHGEQVGDPLFGTLVRSEDEGWLADHIDAAVAVLYFLGDDDQRGRPAECFAYHRITLKDDSTGDSDLVGYWTKHGYLMESSGSMVLYPPLAARGNMRAYGPKVDSPENQQLLTRFDANAYDRLAVAVRQYFRTQFTDTFTSPPAEDYALHCGAIEATFDIDALKPGVSERFVEALTSVFGNDDRFETFFLGLYVSRSVFVHGVATNKADESENKEAAAYRMFKRVRCKLTLMRRLTRDVILESLGRKKDEFGFFHDKSALALLATVLHSSGTWEKLKRLLNKPKAADEVENMSSERFKEVEELAFQTENYFNWQCVEENIDKAQVFKAICTCAILLGGMTRSSGPVYAESDTLGKAADAKDGAAIEAWCLNDPWRDFYLRDGDRISAIVRLTRTLARFFEKQW